MFRGFPCLVSLLGWVLLLFLLLGLLGYHWSASGVVLFYFWLRNSAGALFSSTVAPIGACCICISRTNFFLAPVTASQSRHSCEALGFAQFWALWVWSVFFFLVFRLLECVGVLFDWEFAFILWLFHFLHRFHVLSPRASSGFVYRALLRSFGVLLVQSILWLLLCILLVVVHLFIVIFGWLLFSSFKFRLVLLWA